MNGARAKKLRREARRMLRGATVSQVAWWARPRVLSAVTWAAATAYRYGWKAPARWWTAALLRDVGVRRVPLHVPERAA